MRCDGFGDLSVRRFGLGVLDRRLDLGRSSDQAVCAWHTWQKRKVGWAGAGIGGKLEIGDSNLLPRGQRTIYAYDQRRTTSLYRSIVLANGGYRTNDTRGQQGGRYPCVIGAREGRA